MTWTKVTWWSDDQHLKQDLRSTRKDPRYQAKSKHEDHTNRVCGVAATVYRREQGPRRFSWKLDSEDSGEHSGEACRKARRTPTCAWGRPEAIHGVTWLGAWPLRGIPCEGLQQGLGKAWALLDTSVKITESSTGVCISTSSLPSVFTLLCRLCALLS